MTDQIERPVEVRGTELQADEDRRRYREKIARITLDALPHFVWLLDAHGTILESNRAALMAVGAEPVDLEGQPIWVTAWWQGADETRAELRDAVARASRGETLRWETRVSGYAGSRQSHVIEISLIPVTDEDGLVIFLGMEGRDVTERVGERELVRERESLAGIHEALGELATMTQPLTDPAAIMAAAAQLLVGHLRVDRCAYAQVEEESTYVITGDCSVGIPSIVGRWPVEAFGTTHLAMMKADEPFVVDDVESDPRIDSTDLPAYRATNIGAAICIPLHKGKKFTAAMAVHQKGPRRWKPSEVRLVTAVVARCWETLERARIERSLRDIRSRMEAALAAGAIGTWSWEIEANRFYGDESLGRIFSVPMEAVAGGPIERLMESIHPDDLPRVQEEVAFAISSGERYAADYRVLQEDGSWRWVAARGQVKLGSDGQTAWFPGVVIDITDSKRAEESLASVREDSERRRRLYETILSSTPDLVYVFDLNHRFVYANEMLLRMWGKTWDEAIGKNCLELGYEPWHAAMHDREIEQVVATKQPIRGEVPFAGTFGRRIYDYIFVPVLGIDGEVEAIAGTTRDVTERKEMEEELRDTDRRKDDFIALLAHELRNPLAPIRNGLQVMRLAESDPAMQAAARGMMDRQLTHMVRLIDDLLDISRINRNKMQLRRERVALADVIASAVETVQPVIDEAGHELSVTLPGAPVYLDADLTRLAQVFSNLLTNSAKYTPKGGRITLTATQAEESLVVCVADNGIGIPASSLPDIFDMFSQVDRPLEKSAGGLGIGLALVKGLVEMHGGSVVAASEGDGKGTIFTVTLPAFRPADSLETDAPDGLQSDTQGLRVLVVDDNRDGAESLAMMLRLLNHDVATANDGIQAIAEAERFRPEIIFMDVGMPHLNGLEATRRIRECDWGHGIRIIALTGWGQENDRDQSRAAGCDGHLVKPVELKDLQRVLDEEEGRS